MMQLGHSNLFRVLGVCFALVLGEPARADSWLPPREFDALSENRRFIARVIPGTTNSKPRLIVSSIAKAKPNEIWHAELSNRVSPTDVYVADDGGSVVTLDNYFGIGYGDDVVAVYGRTGQLAKFSLEQIAPPKPKTDTPSRLSDRHAYERKFSHSTASRHWREKSIQFFFRESNQLFFCLWLDWESRWVVWRMSDGKMIATTGERAKALNAEGRRRSLAQANSGGFDSAALNFLGRLRFKEDRPLIETWLRDGDFSGGSMQSYSSENASPVFAFTARSYKREVADRILARWDGKNADDSGPGGSDRYEFLGTLKCTVRFTRTPAKNEGTIRLYLLAESTPLKEWSFERPSQYLIANLDQSYPYLFEGSRTREGTLSNTVNFIIYGVAPGRYRVKAAWDKALPFAKDNEITFKLQSGDYENLASPAISIHRGGVTDGVLIDCMTLVR